MWAVMLTSCIIFHVDMDCVKFVLSLTLSFVAKPPIVYLMFAFMEKCHHRSVLSIGSLGHMLGHMLGHILYTVFINALCSNIKHTAVPWMMIQQFLVLWNLLMIVYFCPPILTLGHACSPANFMKLNIHKIRVTYFTWKSRLLTCYYMLQYSSL